MEYAGLNILDDDRCEFLRWKGMFVDTDHDPMLSAGDRLFWCQKTQNCLGPDGKLADDYECNAARSCYKAL